MQPFCFSSLNPFNLKIIDEMIVDALVAADKAFPLPDGIPLSQAIDNLDVIIKKM